MQQWLLCWKVEGIGKLTLNYLSMANTIVFANRKGGVCKTTSTANIAAALAMVGKKVLAIDLDPQASLTRSFGIDPGSISETSASLIKNKECNVRRLVIPLAIAKCLHLIPSNTIPLLKAEGELKENAARITRLKNALNKQNASYDLVAIDTGPAVSNLTVAALISADKMVVPTTANGEGYEAALDAYGLYEEVVELNKGLSFYGILACNVDDRLLITRSTLKDLGRHGFIVHKPCVAHSVRVEEAYNAGVPIVVREPSHKSAVAYIQLACKLVEVARKRRAA